jgi:hypothetical protein
VPRALVVGRTAVAEPDVEVAVGTERELAAVVVRLRVVDGEEVALRSRVDHASVHGELVDSRVAVATGVVDVEVRTVRRERQAEQAALTAVGHLILEVEHRTPDQPPVANGADPSGLFGHVQRRVARSYRECRRAQQLGDPRQLHARRSSCRTGARHAHNSRREHARRRDGDRDDHARDGRETHNGHEWRRVSAEDGATTSRTMHG